MFKAEFERARNFLGFVGTSLSGITAVLIAVGFLAERSHLRMLGFAQIPIDLNEYIFSGMRFFIYLPIKVIESVSLYLLNVLEGEPIYILVGLVSVVAWVLMKRSKVIQSAIRNLLRIGRQFLKRKFMTFLMLIVLFEVFGIYESVAPATIRNILFQGDRLDGWMLQIENAIRTASGGDLGRFMGWLFVISFTASTILVKAKGIFNEIDEPDRTAGQKIVFGVAALLLVTMLVLLPVNYGILMLPNEFSTVEISIRETTPEATASLFLIQEDGDGLYLYSQGEKRIRYVKRSDISSLYYLGRQSIFPVRE